MKTKLAPPSIRNLVVEMLTDETHPAYGQAATTGTNGHPQIRTVHFKYVERWDAIAFGAHVKSPKWAQLQKTPYVTGCYFDMFRLKQFRWDGGVRLLDANSSGEGEQEVLREIWQSVRPDVRSSYWTEFKGLAITATLPDEISLDDPCPDFSVVVTEPTLWDIYTVHPEDYRKGGRALYERTDSEWRETPISLVSTKRL